MKNETRLLRKKEKQTIRNIVISVVLLVGVIIFFFAFGIPLLINFSLYLERMKGGATSATGSNNQSYIAPPVINPMPTATNSAHVIISGYSLPNNTIKLYVNDHLAGSQQLNDNKTFSFTNVSLNEGDNSIKAKTVTSDGKESDFSEVTNITYSNKAPKLDIDSPHDGQSFNSSDNPIKILGTTDTGAQVKINDYWAIVDDQGKFSYILPLPKGDTQLHIVASDDAGNQTTKDLKVTLNQ